MRVLVLSGNPKEMAGSFKGLQERFSEELAVKYALKATDAAELLREIEFDLFILDADLAAVENSNTDALRSSLSGIMTSMGGIPTVILGSGGISYDEAIELGADAYIAKSDLCPALLYHSIRQIQRLRLMEKKLQEKEEQILLTEQHSPVLILKQDKNLRYSWSSNSFLGYSAYEIKGKTDAELFPAEDALVLAAIKKQVIESSVKTRKIIRTRVKSKEYYYDISIEPEYDLYGNVTGVICTALDITDKKIVEREFQRAKSLLEKMFASLNEAVFVSEKSGGKIIACNPVVEKIFGYRTNEVIGKTPEFLFPSPEHYERLRTQGAPLLEKKSVFRTEFQMKRKDGAVIETEHTINLLKKSKGWDEVLITIISDITERKRTERALVYAKEKAERSDRIKTEFLAQMSHEVRTPINTILTYSGLLREEFDKKGDDELRKNFKIIENAGKRIIRTVDLILNMSELQTGTYELFPRELDICNDILLSLYVEFKKYAAGKGLRMQFYNNAPDTNVTADEYSTSQVFRSIIDNAVKYTDQGEIKIVLERDKENRLVVSVEDTGIGIAENYLQKIFEPFTQEDQSYTRSYQGNGLGLALAKKYAELNKAVIEVNSQKGSGSVFRVVFIH